MIEMFDSRRGLWLRRLFFVERPTGESYCEVVRGCSDGLWLELPAGSPPIRSRRPCEEARKKMIKYPF